MRNRRASFAAFGAIKGNLFLLGLTSFFTDMASEMVYPLLPFFFSGLVSSAAVPVFIGLMDGIAESTSSLLKILAGRWSDRTGIRKNAAVLGYGISSLFRPLNAFAVSGWQVVMLRFVDRIGKGIRTSPRDALLSESVDSGVRGVAFSFQRLMDHAGAVLGPVTATVFLTLFLGKGFLWRLDGAGAGEAEMTALRWLFALSILPGIAATAVLWLFVRERPRQGAVKNDTPGSAAAFPLPSSFFLFLAAVVLFTLGNSSDLFLIYYTQTRFGLGLGWVIALWVMLHLSKIAFSLPGGRFSDIAGRKPAIVTGWLVYIAVYAAMPFAGNIRAAVALLLVYGAYYGLTEGAERAIVADIVPETTRGRAYGLYHGAVGIAALPASLLFGALWAAYGAQWAFFTGAALAACAVVVLTGSFGIIHRKKNAATAV